MEGIYLVSVWLHIMAAVVWVGGTLFRALCLFPPFAARSLCGEDKDTNDPAASLQS
jgi:uncharacterized membrane protein